jgi:hypothetical protein
MDESRTRTQIKDHADAVVRGDMNTVTRWREVDGRPTIVAGEPLG